MASVEISYSQIIARQEIVYKGQPNGYASLNGSGVVPLAEMPLDSTHRFATDAEKASYVLIDGTRDINYSSGEWQVGNVTGGNYTRFEADGTVVFIGNATVWDDLRIPGLSVKTGASAPDLAAFLGAGSLLVLAFDGAATLEQCYFTAQLPHSYKEGTNLYPHVHWTPTTADAGDVVWQLEYSWVNVDGTFGASTTIETAAAAAGGTAWVHKKTSFAAITGASKTISSMLVCRLFRDPAHASDTYTHDAAFLEVDFHYEIDTVGSRAALTK